MSDHKYSFPKSEKLKSRKLIELLFQNGKMLKSFPIQMVFMANDFAEVACQAGFSVPKKRVKLAVNRNRIKRLMRESYRLNKHLLIDRLTQENSKKYVIMFIYQSNEILKFYQVNKLIISLLEKLKSEI